MRLIVQRFLSVKLEISEGGNATVELCYKQAFNPLRWEIRNQRSHYCRGSGKPHKKQWVKDGFWVSTTWFQFCYWRSQDLVFGRMLNRKQVPDLEPKQGIKVCSGSLGFGQKISKKFLQNLASNFCVAVQTLKDIRGDVCLMTFQMRRIGKWWRRSLHNLKVYLRKNGSHDLRTLKAKTT